MRLIRRDDLTAQPWKNGGGRTWEIAASPEGAGFDAFGWRVSMAEVAADGPFSAFAGIDRTLSVLSGAMLLDFAAGGTVALDAAAPPLAFPGEAAVQARLVQGPVIDLNVMTRRGAFGHRVTALRTGEAAPQGTMLLIARAESTLDSGLALARGTVLRADPQEDLAGLRGTGALLAVGLRAL